MSLSGIEGLICEGYVDALAMLIVLYSAADSFYEGLRKSKQNQIKIRHVNTTLPFYLRATQV